MPRKVNAYRCSQEVFQLVKSAHRVQEGTFSQYMALCEAGGDISSAYRWIRNNLESQASSSNDGQIRHNIAHYVWLLRVARRSPRDDDVEEMCAAVREVYDAEFSSEDADGNRSHLTVDSDSHTILVHELFRLLKELAPRLHDTELTSWIAAMALKLPQQQLVAPLPDVLTADEVRPQLAVIGALGLQHHALFPQLEWGLRRRPVSPSIKSPHLIDSLFSDAFVDKLEEASFSFDVRTVTNMISAYLEDITAELAVIKEQESAKGSGKVHHHHVTSTNPVPVWRDYYEPSAKSFRFSLVQSKGIPPELYHYLIKALAVASPRLALSTRKKMLDQGMRVLDLTRAVLIVAARGNRSEQLELLKEQMDDVSYRKQLDDDYDICKAVEAFWKFDYALFLHYRNALTMETFYQLLMDELGVADVQRMICELHDKEATEKRNKALAMLSPAEKVSQTATSQKNLRLMGEEDVVVLDDDCRAAVRNVLRKRRGQAAVARAVDIIVEHTPQLDLALMSVIPYFSDYTLPQHEEISTNTAELRLKFAGIRNIFLMDASFIESGESFMTIPSAIKGATVDNSIILIPYATLSQLADTAEDHVYPCFDENVSRVRAHERNTSRQRLRFIASALQHQASFDKGESKQIPVKVLHFTESLLSHMIDSSVPLQPETSDDDQLIATALMLDCSLNATDDKEGGQQTQVFLCTDDPQLTARLRPSTSVEVQTESARLLAEMLEPITLVSFPKPSRREEVENPPAEVAEWIAEVANTANYQKLFADDERLQKNVVKRPEPAQVATRGDEGTPTISAASWLDMLDEQAHDVVQPVVRKEEARDEQQEEVAIAPPAVSPPAADDSEEAEKEIFQSTHALESLAHHKERIRLAMTRDLFNQFGVVSPDDLLDAQQMEEARLAASETDGKDPKRRRKSVLELEANRNSGYTFKKRGQLARHMSNMAGSRVPFNFRYKVFEANVNDPRNASLLSNFKGGIDKKRSLAVRR